MEQREPDDFRNRGKTVPGRVLGYIFRKAEDYRTEPVDPYQVVHSQEPIWVLYLRLTEPGGEDTVEFRIVLRPTGDSGWWPGTWTASFTSGREGKHK